MSKHYRSLFGLAFIIILIMTSGCASNSPTSPDEENPIVDLDGMKSNTNNVLSLEEYLPQANEDLRAPSDLTAHISGEAESNRRVILSWTDNSLNEVGFLIERKVDNGFWVQYRQVDAGVVTYSDFNLEVDKTFSYRVQAVSTTTYSDYSNEASVFVEIAIHNPKPTI